MYSITLFVETGTKKIFVGAIDWPGWCRSGRDEHLALQSLFDYRSRYKKVLRHAGIQFQVPADLSDFTVIERHLGSTTTDFGAPAVILDADKKEMNRADLEDSQKILVACWQAFDGAVQSADGKELRKGPRGGGRDTSRIQEHVLDADRGYLSRLAWKHKRVKENEYSEEFGRIRQAILEALEAAASGGLPIKGPRRGIIWPARYFIRRVAWHVLDHAWEIEDRIE